MRSAITWTINIVFIYAFIGSLLWTFLYAKGAVAHVRLERMAKGRRPDSKVSQVVACLGTIVLWPLFIGGYRWSRGGH